MISSTQFLKNEMRLAVQDMRLQIYKCGFRSDFKETKSGKNRNWLPLFCPIKVNMYPSNCVPLSMRADKSIGAQDDAIPYDYLNSHPVAMHLATRKATGYIVQCQRIENKQNRTVPWTMKRVAFKNSHVIASGFLAPEVNIPNASYASQRIECWM